MDSETAKPAEKRRLGDLALVWRMAMAYPGQIAAALAALLASSGATLGIPYAFKRIIDRGFTAGGGTMESVARSFHYMLMIVAVLAIATALRFYFVSWLG